MVLLPTAFWHLLSDFALCPPPSDYGSLSSALRPLNLPSVIRLLSSGNSALWFCCPQVLLPSALRHPPSVFYASLSNARLHL